MSAQEPIKQVTSKFQELTLDADRDEKMPSAELIPMLYAEQAKVPILSMQEIEDFTSASLNLSKSIDFSDLSTQVKLALFQRLAAKKTLVSLDLSGTGMTTEDAQMLARCLNGNTNLKELDISSNKIRSTGALALVPPHTAVDSLFLRCTFLDDDFAKKLPREGKPFKTDLVQNFITNEGAKLLIDNPRIKDSLCTLLRGNMIDDIGVINKILAISPVYLDADDPSSDYVP